MINKDLAAVSLMTTRSNQINLAYSGYCETAFHKDTTETSWGIRHNV